MMNCSRCNSPNNEGRMFCILCGNELTLSQSDETGSPEPEIECDEYIDSGENIIESESVYVALEHTPTPTYKSTTQQVVLKPRKTGWIILVVSIIVVVVIGLSIFKFLPSL